jgi:hypothetical protein
MMKPEDRILEFKTWSEMVSHADLAPCTGSETDRRSSRDGRPEFTQTENWEHAVRLASAGWPEGTKKATKLSQQIESKLYNIIQFADISYDVTGELLDVGRFCAGEPEHWGNWEYTFREGKGTKYVHIVVSGFVSCGVSAESLIARGVTIAALVNMLELGGCRAKITLCFALSGKKSGDWANVLVPLKEYDDVLDLDRITFGLAHPSMYRRLMFSIMETLPVTLARSVGAFAYYSTPGGEVKDQGDIFLDRMVYAEPQWETVDSSVTWILDKLKEQGVLANEETINQ